MIDIYHYVQALKITWLRTFACFPQLRNASLFDNDFSQRCYKNINKNFWRDCIKAFYEFSIYVKVTDFKDFLSEQPFLQLSNKKIDRKTFLRKKMA